MKNLHRAFVGVLLVAVTLSLSGIVKAATFVNLGDAQSFSVLAGTAITNTPTSTIGGDVGLSPAAGGNYAGLTDAEVAGTIYAVDGSGPGGSQNNPGLLTDAKNDLTTAYINAAGQTPTTTFATTDNQLGGQTLTPGVYAFGHGDTANLIGTLTLDAQGNEAAVFIFQASSDLVTASGSVVQLVNGAQACNVFWQVTSSATLGTSTTFVGTIMALTSITDNGSSSINGRLLARNAAVVLNSTTITGPSCSAGGLVNTGGISAAMPWNVVIVTLSAAAVAPVIFTTIKKKIVR